ncbi:MAG: hypothetical protein WBQ85_15220 [Candidatus Sulfotelmatobacter sp.]
MRRCRFISSTPLIAGLLMAGLLTGLLFAILVVPLDAADSDSWYDVSKEVTLSGTVSRVLHTPAPGMIWGSHLMVGTAFGKLDASLGRFGLEGKGALSVIAGQQIELTGVVKTVRDKEVFVVRRVKATGMTYTMRNEHGIEVSPLTRKRAAEKGVTL